MTKENSGDTKKTKYKGEYFTFTLTEIDKGIAIEFIKDAQTHEVRVTKKSAGYTSMGDYYQFGNTLTYNEFNELKNLVNKVEDLVANYSF